MKQILPRYSVRKEVTAARILAVQWVDQQKELLDGSDIMAVLVLAIPGSATSTSYLAARSFMRQNTVAIGDYLVVHDDGHECCISARAFLDAYAPAPPS